MRGRPAARRCGYWKAKSSWRVSPGSGTTFADAPGGYDWCVQGRPHGVGSHALRMCLRYTFRVLLMYLLPGCGLQTAARLGAATHPQRPHPGKPDPAPDHPARPGPLSRRRTRRPVPETVDNRNLVPAPEADRPRYRPRPARTLRDPGPPGGLGAPARAQHDRRARRPRRRHRRPHARAGHLHRRAVPDPRRDHRRHLLPPLPQAPGQRKRPVCRAGRRHPHPPARPRGPQRTSGRTAAERRTWTREPADYTITIVPSNLPKTDISLRS